MPTSFTPKFADLVRCTSSTTGTGNLVLGAPVAGFTSFAATLSVGDRFYYSVAGIDKPVEAEVGRGTLMADGSIAREAIAGALTNFSLGQKTVSLVAGAEWFRKASAGAVDMTSVATRAQSDLGAAINELVGLTPLFSEIATTHVPATVRRIATAGRTAVGQSPAAYIRDPDQSINTSIGQQLIDAVTAAEGATAGAAAASAVRAILDRVRVKDADNQFWVIDDDGCEVHAGHFGAVADGGFSYATGDASGTDNSAAIQALIDWRNYLRTGASSGRECRIPAGKFRLSKGLQLGYGDTFRTVVLRGEGPSFDGNLPGTSLICDFDNHPAISISGGRLSFAVDLALCCPRGLSYLYNKQFGDFNNAAMINFGIDDRDLTRWCDPAHPTMSPYLRYNVFAAIAVDPYFGTQPAAALPWAASAAVASGEYRTANGKLYIAKVRGTTAPSGPGPAVSGDNIGDGTTVWAWAGAATLATFYPSATPPAFLPAVSRITYGKAFRSSDVALSRVRINGFAVGLVVQPSDADGNGDFAALSDCDISSCAIQISVGNTQSRNVGATRLTGSVFHTAVTTNKHGRQNGKLGGVFHNCSWWECHQLIDIGSTAIVGPHSFRNCYVEDVRRIGDVYPFSTILGSTTTFEACEFQFVHDRGNGKRGVPLTVLGNRLGPAEAASLSSSFVFRDCLFGNHLGLLPLIAQGVKLENSSIIGAEALVFTSQWRARAQNTLAGGLVLPRLAAVHQQLIHYQAVNETSLSADRTTMTGRPSTHCSRNYPASIYTGSLSPTNGQSLEAIPNPASAIAIDKASMTGMSLAGRVLTFTYPGLSAFYARSQGLAAGSVLFDNSNSMAFVVQGVTGTTAVTVTAELQNGYSYAVGGGISYELPFVSGAGFFYAAPGGIFTPEYPLFADLNASSATLANCQRADGWGGFISATTNSSIQAGDAPFVDQLTDLSMSDGVLVAAVAAGSITLNGPPNVTAAKRRLALWVRGS